MRIRLERLKQAALFHLLLFGLRWAFLLTRLREARFRKAISSLKATYQFRSGKEARQLIFDQGRITTRRGIADRPDYLVTFVDLARALKTIKEEPNNVFKLLMENMVRQEGNTYYLFLLGYLLSLSEGQLRELAARLPFGLGQGRT